MRHKCESNSTNAALRFIVGLTTSLFVLSAGAVLNAGGSNSHKGRFWKGDSRGCGDTITTDTSLFTDLDCSGHSGGAALTLQAGANLNMNGRKLIGNSGINCIEIIGDGAKIRDGIEIEEGSDNRLYYNHAADNGNPDTCADFMEDYKPWYYAGIDVLAGSENNEIKYNRAGCNSGCVGTDEAPCAARERDFWDENVDQDGNSISTNRWWNNHIECENPQPESGISP